MSDEAARRALVLSRTRPLAPFGLPGLTLHLLPPEAEAWRDGAASLGAELPYWAFAWPGGVALAQAVLACPGLVAGRRVLDFGCGGAVEGVAAALAGAREVEAWDVDPLALTAAGLNAQLNGVALTPRQGDPVGRPLGSGDALLVGDVLYSAEAAAHAWPWLWAAAEAGATVLVGDPGRAGLPEGLELLGTWALPHDGDPRGTTLWDTSAWRVPARACGASPIRHGAAP